MLPGNVLILLFGMSWNCVLWTPLDYLYGKNTRDCAALPIVCGFTGAKASLCEQTWQALERKK